MKCRLSVLFASIVAVCAAFQQGCRPIEVRIVGTFELDTESGCSDCPQGGPLVMWFDGSNVKTRKVSPNTHVWGPLSTVLCPFLGGYGDSGERLAALVGGIVT